MLSNSQVTCWVVTDGKAGMENQALGLAEALGLKPVVKRIKLRSPWRQLTPFLRWGLASAFSKEGDLLVPPWPDLVIATGRASIAASLYLRHITKVHSKRGCFTVQLQNPTINPHYFDLVVVPEHDRLKGTNVIATRGGLHRVTPQMLKSEAEKFLPQFAHLPSPRIAVLVGGSNAVYTLTPCEMQPIADQLVTIARQTGGSLMVTPSRRTGADNLSLLQNALRDVPSSIWDGQGPNPYYAMLGLADFLLVTCDSVNMISEACTTGKPVYVIDLPGGSRKFNRFHNLMLAEGMTRSFKGKIEKWQYPPLDDVGAVVARIQEMMGLKRDV